MNFNFGAFSSRVKSLRFLALVGGMVGLLLTGSIALAQGLPPGVTMPYQADAQSITQAGEFDMIQQVIDFAPGAGVPLHTHGGPVLVTVLEGEITLHDSGMTMAYKAGDHWFEPIGHQHSVANESSSNVRVSVLVVLPKGANVLTLEGGVVPKGLPPGVTMPYQASEQSVTLPGTFGMVQQVIDFAPGAGVPLHTHGGPVLVTVLEGEITVQDSGMTMTYKAGDHWFEPIGHQHSVANESVSNVRVSVFALLPEGAALLTLVNTSPAGMPRTGGEEIGSQFLPVLLFGTAVVLAGIFTRRALARR